MRYIRAFGRFWWDFVVGDDWRVAVGLGVSLALVWFLEHEGLNVWWLLPVAVALILAAAVRRESRAGG